MSITSTTSYLSYTITTLPQLLTTFAFNQPGDLLVSDGATALELNSDYTVSGGGYNGANQLQTGEITVVGTGANAVQIGDVITISRDIPAVQTTTFSSTGLLTPLMIESDDDKLTTLIQQLETSQYNPFPAVAGGTNLLTLGWITAETGGIRTSIDSLDIVNIPTVLLPLFIMTSITYSGAGDGSQGWKLRVMQVGDPSASIAGAFIVPIVNPNNLIWVRVF